MAWALLESKEGNLDEARRLFDAGRKADPGHVTLVLTLPLSPTRTLPQTRTLTLTRTLARTKARTLTLTLTLTKVDPGHAPLLSALASLEVRAGNTAATRTLTLTVTLILTLTQP